MKFSETIKNKKTRKRKTLKYSNTYVFGYGSIVNKASREITIGKVNRKHVYPVIMSKKAGYERVWTCIDGKHHNFSFLNILKTKRPQDVNGIIFKVNKTQLKSLYDREFRYELVKIPLKYLSYFNSTHSLADNFPKNSVVYAFSNIIDKCKPKCYIMQSYIDVVSRGFLEYGKEFETLFKASYKDAKEQHDIINDTKHPLYTKI